MGQCLYRRFFLPKTFAKKFLLTRTFAMSHWGDIGGRMRQGNARIIVIHPFVFGLIIFFSQLVESDGWNV